MKCGNAGDPDFDHTWFEGVKACQHSSSMSGKAKQLKGSRQQQSAQHQTIGPAAGSVSGDITDSAFCGELNEIIVFISLMLITPLYDRVCE